MNTRLAITALFTLSLGTLSLPVQAQNRSSAPSVSLELRDASVRTTLEAIFKQAGIKNYLIDSGVQGFVTLTLTDQPVESALKLVVRASTLPLTYTIEKDVWIVKQRQSTPPLSEPPAVPLLEAAPTVPRYERISLTYLDPADLSAVLGGILLVRQFTRQGANVFSGTGVFPGNGSLGQAGNGIVLQGSNSGGSQGPRPQ